jgi:chromosome segregation ATPase
MSSELDTAKAEVNRLEKDFERLTGQATDLDARRAETQGAINKTRREITAAQTRVRELSDEPHAKLELERLLDELRGKLSKASTASPTANALRRRLGELPGRPFSTAAKLKIAREMLKETDPAHIYQRDRRAWDAKLPPLPGRESR